MESIKYICSVLALCYSMTVYSTDPMRMSEKSEAQHNPSEYAEIVLNIHLDTVKEFSKTIKKAAEEEVSLKRIANWKDKYKSLLHNHSVIRNDLEKLGELSSQKNDLLELFHKRLLHTGETLEQMEQEERAKPTLADLMIVLNEISGSLKDLRDHLLPKDDKAKAADSSVEKE